MSAPVQPAAGHEFAVRVYFEDTDAGGIVYHANYLRFAERARTEWLRTLGYDHRRLAAEHGLLFAVARAGIDFVRPARLDDLLRVRTRALRIGGASLELEQFIYLEESEAARVRVTLAVVDTGTLRLRRLPEALRQHFAPALAGTAASP